MAHYNIKIKVNGPEHSAAIQGVLFRLGYEWLTRHKTPIQTPFKYLYADTFGVLMHGDDDVGFKLCDYAENILYDDFGEFKLIRPENRVPIEGAFDRLERNLVQPIEGLRPLKYVIHGRIREILRLMTKYAKRNVQFPNEWAEELSKLNADIANYPDDNC